MTANHDPILLYSGPGHAFDHTFVCTGTYDPRQPGSVSPPPAHLPASAASSPHLRFMKPKKGSKGSVDVPPLAMMDIFAGCGGLSEGVHQSGVAETKWAIEFDPYAAQAFERNNPHAKVFCNDCSVLLRVSTVLSQYCTAGCLLLMTFDFEPPVYVGQGAAEEAGLADNDLKASDSCIQAASKLSSEDRETLPRPGEVKPVVWNMNE